MQDTKAYMQLCVSEFISFVTSEASDKCIQEKRKTVNGDVSRSRTNYPSILQHIKRLSLDFVL